MAALEVLDQGTCTTDFPTRVVPQVFGTSIIQGCFNFGMFSEEDAIMRAQQLKLIYSQSGLLYDIFLDAPLSILDKARKMLWTTCQWYSWFITRKIH
jgi:hypothetical protein